jgi:hypothetical protein
MRNTNKYAEVMELADVSDSKSDVLRDVWVQVPPSAPLQGNGKTVPLEPDISSFLVGCADMSGFTFTLNSI